MAKKQGLNLSGSADASIIAAATKASLATAPPDYSKIFSSVAANYDATMQANAKMWGSIAGTIAKVGVEIKKTLDGPPMSKALEDLLATEEGKIIFNDMQVNQDALIDAYKRLDFKDVRRLVKERNEIYSYAESSVGNISAVKTLHENDAIDPIATGLNDYQQSNALMATIAGKTTDLGFHWLPTKNEDGQQQWGLYHDSTKVKQDVLKKYLDEGAVIPGYSQGEFKIDSKGRVIGSDGKPILKNAVEFQKNLVTKADVQNATNAISADLNGFMQMGARSKTGYSGLNESQANVIVDKYGDKRAPWFAKSFGSTDGKSFYERVNSVSNLSAKLFTEIGAAIDLNKLGLEDVPTTSKGITIADLQQSPENYKILTLAMFNTGDNNYDAAATAKVFKADLKDQLKKVYNSQWANNPNNPKKENIVKAPFSNKQNYGDNVMGSNLNVIWDAFNKGEVTMVNPEDNTKVVYNKQSDGSWKSPNETISADQLLTKVDEALGWSKNLLSMDEFKNFRGTVGASNTNDGDGNNQPNPLIPNLIEVKDGQVIKDAQIGTGVLGIGKRKRNIKKINGEFFIQKAFDYTDDPEFIKPTPSQLKFIKAKYK